MSAQSDTPYPASVHDILYEGGPTGLLLIHGLGGTPVELKRIARAVHAAGHTAYCCTLAGHCGTEADLVATRWQDWYASVEAAFDRLSARCERVVVGGLSLGAVLALHLAARRGSDVHGLALYAPTLWYDGWAMPWYRALLKVAVYTPIGRRYRFVEREPFGIRDARIRARVAAAMLGGDSAEAGLAGTPAHALRELWRISARVRRELPEVKAPAILLHARTDDISSLRNSTHIAGRLGGIADLTVLDDSYHIVTLDRQRNVVIERTLALMSRIGTSGAKPVMLRQSSTPMPLATLRDVPGGRRRPSHAFAEAAR
ncbi:esterase/lipase [Azorhizobium sp. AG788]|uniref:alpha/beta hydrolase n=1 Tax=Azorhizobium sp. AG788 TaxID=2183897 RepID=UPI0010F1C92D|nr:alpha/beta fold hydrolase [Azorhizobium sp. AG788]TDU00714.1 esterase/lipase [Azorhizobium sp. AG788]